MAYRHKIVEGLAQFIEHYGGKSGNPMISAIWFGVKHEVPLLLEALDNNEEAVAEIEKRLREVLSAPELLLSEVVPVEEPISFMAPPEEQPESRRAKKATTEMKPAKESGGLTDEVSP